jgi:hypothetical protein
MANTVIQIKRSTVTTAPTAGSLSAAEPAYSYLSDKLFIGSSDGSQVIEIGGRYYINVSTQAYDTANIANVRAVAAFEKANLAFEGSGATAAAFDKANAANIIASQAFDKANSANLLAYNTGIGANAYATAVGTGSNNYLLAVIAGANTAVGAGANAFASATIAGANTAVGAGANAFSAATIAGANTAVGAGANAFSAATIAGANTAVGAGANAYALSIVNSGGAGANTYADGTFIKRVAASQTITGNLAITGSLTVSGNAYTIDTETLRVSDPLIYLAGNNYTSDIVDIGFVGNYNTGSANLHTGIFRDATIKEYYVFDGYNQEPNPNHIDTSANGFSLAVLNATIKTSNLILGGANAILTIAGVGTSANAFAAATIAGANSAVGAGANAYAASIGTASNNYLLAVIAGANTAVGAGANAFSAATIAGANSAVGAGANAFASATIAGANTAVGAGANNYLLAVIAGANTAVGTGANNYLLSVIAGANTAVGAGANAYADLVGAAANTNASNASYLSTGTVPSARISGSYTGITGVGTITTGVWNGTAITVPYGGTGASTFANNGILFGNLTSPVRVTAAGIEGNVLQVNNQGTPLFGMLDGGTF